MKFFFVAAIRSGGSCMVQFSERTVRNKLQAALKMRHGAV